MTKSWRPEGWQDGMIEKYGEPCSDWQSGYEAGADAMLKVIREKGQPNFLAFLHHCIREVPEITIGKGVYFFLPDDEER